MITLTQKNTWQQLRSHALEINKTNLKELFEKQNSRYDEFCYQQDKINLDCSSQLINSHTLSYLFDLANECDLTQKIQDLFTGKHVNFTEKQAALHTATRDLHQTYFNYNDENIMLKIHETLNRIKSLSDNIRKGNFLSSSQQIITDVINIGIGGSELGPRFVAHALRDYTSTKINMHFISNIDPFSIESLLPTLNPATTLVIITSKSFNTLDTITNSDIIFKWLNDKTAITKQVIAITNNIEKATQLGIKTEHILPLFDFVGGRYSIFSAVGLINAIQIGFDNFKLFLEGAHNLDLHFKNAPIQDNLPVLMALIGIWNINFLNASSLAIIPYASPLKHFINYLQQLDMESNGKSINSLGELVDYNTGPIIWGGIGTNSQHSFHQLLHQGTHFIPIDFIHINHQSSNYPESSKLLHANLTAQIKSLSFGNQLTNQYKTLIGNNPSNLITLDKLSPYSLGQIIALYEHKIYVQGVIWDINSFDQMGVQYSKNIITSYF